MLNLILSLSKTRGAWTVIGRVLRGYACSSGDTWLHKWIAIEFKTVGAHISVFAVRHNG